jgi:hypothetical protein
MRCGLTGGDSPTATRLDCSDIAIRSTGLAIAARAHPDADVDCCLPRSRGDGREKPA